MKLLNKLLSRFSRNMGIDLGTANTVVFLENEGIVIQEPSVVALNQTTREVLAIGYEAYEMVGRTPGDIIAVRPLKDGVVADYDITEAMIKSFIQKASKSSKFKPKVVVGVPYGITEVERRAVLDASISAGSSEAYLIEEPMAAAIGANINVAEARGNFIVDIGGGTTEVAVISLGGIVTCRSIRVAGDELDEAIISHCKKNYNLLIGERMAEKVKIDIGSAFPFAEEKTISVKGRDLLSGLPKTFTLSSYEIRDAISDSIQAIVDTIKITLEQTPPELSSDIMINGIIMTGGGALLHGLDSFVESETGIKVTVAEDPLSCVARGTGKVLEEIHLLPQINSDISRMRW